jgi:hypothetical protein
VRLLGVKVAAFSEPADRPADAPEPLTLLSA